jgi:hypothetical protein
VHTRCTGFPVTSRDAPPRNGCVGTSRPQTSRLALGVVGASKHVPSVRPGSLNLADRRVDEGLASAS